MTKPRKYDNIQGLLVKRISHCSKKGAELFQTSTRGLWHFTENSKSESGPSCRNTTLSLWIHYENFIEAEIMYMKKIQFYSLIFSEILFYC